MRGFSKMAMMVGLALGAGALMYGQQYPPYGGYGGSPNNGAYAGYGNEASQIRVANSAKCRKRSL